MPDQPQQSLLGLLLAGLGSRFNAMLVGIGEAFWLGVSAFYLGVVGLFDGRKYPRSELVRLINDTGVKSLMIVVLVSTLMGMSMVAQIIPSLQPWGTEVLIGGMVATVFTRTMGPVFTAIIFSGRVGAAYTAELGTMKVSEEVLALETMGIPPVGYLIAPRVLAGALMMMALTIVFNFCSLASAYFMATQQYGIDSQQYIEVSRNFIDVYDFIYGVIKAAIFSLMITVTTCYKGFKVRGSGMDVGRATMESVVICIVVVIFGDFVLSLGYNLARSSGFLPSKY